MTEQTPETKEIDEFSNVETTGHTWDGIKELNNPLPRWWLLTMYATIIFAIGYTIAYPAWPLINGATTGVLGWSSRAEFAKDVAAADVAKVERTTAIRDLPLADIIADDDLRQFATSGGQAAYKVNCVQCHGSGAAGSPGYPNLNDDDWLWGGDPEQIFITLQHGVRQADNFDTRFSEMPPFGDILTQAEISDVAWFVRQISNQQADTDAAARGSQVYADNCAACHGDAGEGIRELGSPRLADAVWLNGNEHEEIVTQIRAPRNGVMPAWQERLGEVTLKQLAVYVHGLGGGE